MEKVFIIFLKQKQFILILIINFNGYEETFFSDGTIQKIDENNNLIVELKDGTKEVKYADGREERILPNGNVECINNNSLDGNDNNE